MKFSTKTLLILLSFGLVISVQAQSSKFSTAVVTGLTTPILDNGLGVYLGVHPTYKLTSWFSIESQISYSLTSVSSGFITGNKGYTSVVNTLIGGRFYLVGQGKKNRFFVNLLLGGMYNYEEEEDMILSEFLPGASVGGFVEFKEKICLGITLDTPQHINLKVGYTF